MMLYIIGSAAAFVICLLIWISKYQSNFRSITKTCWFCGQVSKVLLKNSHWWFCQECKQYNGFTDNGDYKNEVKEMREGPSTLYQYCIMDKGELKNQNHVFCSSCEVNLSRKIYEMSLFEPYNENNFYQECIEYENYLNEKYEPCVKCQTDIEAYIEHQDFQIQSLLWDSKEMQNPTMPFSKIPDSTTKKSVNHKKFKWKPIIRAILVMMLIIVSCCFYPFLINHPDITIATVVGLLLIVVISSTSRKYFKRRKSAKLVKQKNKQKKTNYSEDECGKSINKKNENFQHENENGRNDISSKENLNENVVSLVTPDLLEGHLNAMFIGNKRVQEGNNDIRRHKNHVTAALKYQSTKQATSRNGPLIRPATFLLSNTQKLSINKENTENEQLDTISNINDTINEGMKLEKPAKTMIEESFNLTSKCAKSSNVLPRWGTSFKYYCVLQLKRVKVFIQNVNWDLVTKISLIFSLLGNIYFIVTRI